MTKQMKQSKYIKLRYKVLHSRVVRNLIQLTMHLLAIERVINGWSITASNHYADPRIIQPCEGLVGYLTVG
jgi:hypothetical protein